MVQIFAHERLLTWELAKRETWKMRIALKFGDNDAVQFVAERMKILPEYSGMTTNEIIVAMPNLTKCQKLIGVEAGFKNFEMMGSWLKHNAGKNRRFIRPWLRPM